MKTRVAFRPIRLPLDRLFAHAKNVRGRVAVQLWRVFFSYWRATFFELFSDVAPAASLSHGRGQIAAKANAAFFAAKPFAVARAVPAVVSPAVSAPSGAASPIPPPARPPAAGIQENEAGVQARREGARQPVTLVPAKPRPTPRFCVPRSLTLYGQLWPPVRPCAWPNCGGAGEG